MAIRWDEDVEIVVVGYGLAGAVAAIAAHDVGSREMILEKGAHPGGCSILAGGPIGCLRDIEAGIKYFTAVHGENTEPELIEGFVRGLAENEEFIQQLVQAARATVKSRKETRGGYYSLPGRESLYTVTVVDVPNFNGFPWITWTRARGGPMMFRMIMDNIEMREIPVMLSTPAKQLIQDADGAVVGIAAESQGRRVNIRARKAVILATGGFEQSKWMQEQYLQGRPFCSMVPLTHTGDGIVMAQKVGAALRNMWCIFGSYAFWVSDYPMAFRHRFERAMGPNSKMPWIIVDKRGKRYMNELGPDVAVYRYLPMVVFDPDLAGYPRIPSYMIFDETCRNMGPIAFPMGFAECAYEWSEDNLEEIERGWILAANSLEELASKIKATTENENLMDSAVLASTVDSWNQSVQTGEDPFSRPPGTMVALDSPPFYAIPIWPHILTTLGGPVRDAYQRVLDSYGQPIAGLYAVGELGSFLAHRYERGGLLGECFSSGRIAGRHAAGLEPREWDDLS